MRTPTARNAARPVFTLVAGFAFPIAPQPKIHVRTLNSWTRERVPPIPPRQLSVNWTHLTGVEEIRAVKRPRMRVHPTRRSGHWSDRLRHHQGRGGDRQDGTA